MSNPMPFVLKNRPVTLRTVEFSGETNQGFKVLGSDGKVRYDGEALIFDSNKFSADKTKNSSFDHYKLAWYDPNPIKHVWGKEEILVTHVANKQIFRANTAGNLVPSAYEKRVTNVQKDNRLAHGFVKLVGVRNGVVLGFQITNEMIYAAVGVDGEICNNGGFVVPNSDDCDQCSTKEYDCNNFTRNPSYQKFKMNLAEEDFSRYLMFREWQAFTQANGIDYMNWELFKGWRNNNPGKCGLGNKQMYSDWRTDRGDWKEYCLVDMWNKWIVGYKEFYPCNSGPQASCSQGYTNSVLFGNTSTCGSSPTCSHYFTSNGANCYEKKHDTETDNYAAERSCCCEKLANFIDLVPLQARSACDPLMDWIKLGLGIDRSAKTANFYIGNELKFSCTIGLHAREQDHHIEKGGFTKPLDLDMSVVAFGTGSMMDGALPDNYYRFRVTDKNESRTSLTNLGPVVSYKEIYKTQNGELIKATPGFFAVENNADAKAFGQGDIFKIKYYSILSRKSVASYQDPINYGKTECCGASACARSGCLRNQCEEECGNLLDFIDPRELQIEFEQPQRKRVGDDVGLDPYEQESGAAEATSVRAKISKLDSGERYWEKQCQNDFVGINLYNSY